MLVAGHTRYTNSSQYTSWAWRIVRGYDSRTVLHPLRSRSCKIWFSCPSIHNTGGSATAPSARVNLTAYIYLYMCLSQAHMIRGTINLIRCRLINVSAAACACSPRAAPLAVEMRSGEPEMRLHEKYVHRQLVPPCRLSLPASHSKTAEWSVPFHFRAHPATVSRYCTKKSFAHHLRPTYPAARS
jgi:hypothetical protein